MNREDEREIETFFKLNRFWEELGRERGTDRGKEPLIITERKNKFETKGAKTYLQEMRKQYDGQMIIVIADRKKTDGSFLSGGRC